MDPQITILIVDDDPDVREILGGALYNQGYRVIYAENGPKALQKAAEFTPDVILLDIMMPLMDGYEVCRRLRSDPRISEIPVLMITALSDPTSRLQGIEAGADDYISKPFDRAEIRARVRTITRLNRYRRLMAERARFDWVVENADEAYLSIDASGEISYANAAARTLFSLPTDKNVPIQGTFLELAQQQYTLMPPAAWQDWPQLADPSLPLYLIRPQDEQSEAVWFQLSVLDLPWGTDGKLFVRITEVTRAVSFAQEMWSFQSAISHKFNTPLSSILLASGLVRYYGERHGASELIEYAKAIEAGARRLESELNDIVEYVNAPSIMRTGGNLPVSSFPAILNQTAQDLRLESVKLHLKDDGLMQRSLLLSNRAMQIILWEILDNAKKFHPALLPNIEVSMVEHRPGRVLLSFCDDGISLPPEQLTRAIIPYYQGEKTFTGEVAGMGLGLPTVASLVWAVGGNVRLYNNLDHPGVVVELDLPLAPS